MKGELHKLKHCKMCTDFKMTDEDGYCAPCRDRRASKAPPAAVSTLVIAARRFWDEHNDASPESADLDKALEAFSSRVPYDGEPMTDHTNPAIREAVGRIISGAPFPSSRSLAKADQILALLTPRDEDAREYVIWSNEHRCWWAPNQCGYTQSLDRAGRYSRDEAVGIARGARGGWEMRGERNPPEIALPLADAIEQSTIAARLPVTETVGEG